MFEEYADVLTADEACEALRIGYNALYGASCEIGNTDFHLQPKGIFGCICKLTKLSGKTPPGKA